MSATFDELRKMKMAILFKEKALVKITEQELQDMAGGDLDEGVLMK